MTNKEDNGEHPREPRLAALLAVHLVSQVLDEAFVIANAAKESGQPWRYVSMLKNLRSGRLSEADDDEISYMTSKGDSDNLNENKIQVVGNVIATSTPQKYAGCSDELSHSKVEPGFIGQGDEELEETQNELTNSTSMFINQLFDMSEVERLTCDDTEIINKSVTEPIELLTQAMNKIMESYVNTALGMAFAQDVQQNANREPIEKISSENSAFSFLAGTFGVDLDKNLVMYAKEEDVTGHENNLEGSEVIPQITEIGILKNSNNSCNEQANKSSEEITERNDVAIYDNAYLTLNRDYDQCSEDDGDPVLQDPKGLTMQEVELVTASTSDDNLFSYPEPKPKTKEVAAISAVSASASGSRKSTLARRCRTQGARLLACIRGWWRRKTPGKRKEARITGKSRGLCPLSPDARRRATSLLDQRLLRSPSPSRPVVWKFNTVNETLVNSSRWKDYTFDLQPNECGEY